jgi:hypothetical protein
MKKHKKTILGGVIAVMFAAVMSLPGMISAGSLEPPAGPAPTMKTLDEIPPTWSQNRSGTSRFELVLDDTGALDKDTGLVWEVIVDASDYTWAEAQALCYDLEKGGRKGWHLPSVKQLASLLGNGQYPSLPFGHPFYGVGGFPYWSSTSLADDPTSAWYVWFGSKDIATQTKTTDHRVWCVRGG